MKFNRNIVSLLQNGLIETLETGPLIDLAQDLEEEEEEEEEEVDIQMIEVEEDMQIIEAEDMAGA
jgi:hypothetical protein